jgi:coproporphyrinogen III oxidase
MSTTSSLPPEILDRRDRAKAWFEALQIRIVAELERLEDEAPDDLYPGEPGRFDLRPWTRETGVGGGIGGFLKGRLIEKAGVHTSAALARFSPEMAATMPGAYKDPTYVSASISLIVHPRVGGGVRLVRNPGALAAEQQHVVGPEAEAGQRIGATSREQHEAPTTR